MVTTATLVSGRSDRALPGQGYDGVVRVTYGGYYGTGVLLYDGRAVLTAAHLFYGHSGTAAVTFETTAGKETVSASAVTLDPDYDPLDANHDLALVWLSTAAPAGAPRYELYRDGDEIGHTFTLVGYGLTGSGIGGAVEQPSTQPSRSLAQNRFDAEATTLKAALGANLAWNPAPGTQLLADFDDGTPAHDALGVLLGVHDLGLGNQEGLIAPGDSGGPAFINGNVAGIASYTASLAVGAAAPDIDGANNSSFGEIGAWQRISAEQRWIDQSIRAHHPDAPSTPQEVQQRIAEGDSGTRFAYFLLQFTGVRSSPDEILAVDYATRDGTAKAGSDYLPVRGHLNLYPGENQAAIPVEIVGDTRPEPDETFYLDVFNPVGGSFGEGVVKLTAMRTIVDDDGWIA